MPSTDRVKDGIEDGTYRMRARATNAALRRKQRLEQCPLVVR
jgi:hypothetical protein